MSIDKKLGGPEQNENIFCWVITDWGQGLDIENNIRVIQDQ